MKFKGILIFTAILVICLSLLPACTTQNQDTKGSETINNLFKMMPATVMEAESATIYFNDLAKIRHIYGIPLPASGSTQDIKNYYMQFRDIGMGDFGYLTGMDDTIELRPNIVSTLGFGAPNIDADIHVEFPPRYYEILSGNFNPAATQDLFNKKEGWSKRVQDVYTTENYQNVTIHSWGEGFSINLADALAPPHLDRLGRAKPLAVTENYVLYSNSVSDIKAMIDSYSGQNSGLLSLPQYSDISKGLTEMDVYGAIIAKDTLVPSKDAPDSQIPILRKYLAIASGIGKDEKGLYMVLLIANKDAETAKENANILKTRIDKVSITPGSLVAPPQQQLWKTNFTEININAKGNLVMAKLYSEDVHLWRYPMMADFLFQHE